MKNVLVLMLSVSFTMGQNLNFLSYRNDTSEVLSVYEPPPSLAYEQVLNFYRSDMRKREPQFLGFDIQDDNIEV